jgi:hypothetical protein
VGISPTSAKAISTGLNTADTLLSIAEAFRGLREFHHERATYRRVQTILDKVEEVLAESNGVSTRQTFEISNEILMRRSRSDAGERNTITPDVANIHDTRPND